MSREHGNGGAASDRFAGLLSWWGMADPAKGPYEAQLKRLQGFLAGLQQAYGEAYGRQMEGLFAANEHFARATQELLRSRKPADVVAAESALMSALMEEATTQARAWSELVQKLTECYAAAGKDAATEATRTAETAGHGAAAPTRAKHLQAV